MVNIGGAYDQGTFPEGMHVITWQNELQILVCCANHRSRVDQLMVLGRQSFAALNLSLSQVLQRLHLLLKVQDISPRNQVLVGHAHNGRAAQSGRGPASLDPPTTSTDDPRINPSFL